MIEVISCDQNSEEWRQARSGIITASVFSTVLAKGKDGGASLTRKTLLYRLAGEIITGEPAETFSNGAMERGHAMEEEARNFYAFLRDEEPELVGFVRNGRKGASPDALIGTDGLLEIKTHKPELLIPMIFKDEFPICHKPQTQGQLWICERDWVDLVCYWPGMPPFITRAVRDESYISSLSSVVDQFNDELDAIVERLRSYGSQEKSTPSAASPSAPAENEAEKSKTVSEKSKPAAVSGPPMVNGKLRYITHAVAALGAAQNLEVLNAVWSRLEDNLKTHSDVKTACAMRRMFLDGGEA